MHALCICFLPSVRYLLNGCDYLGCDDLYCDQICYNCIVDFWIVSDSLLLGIPIEQNNLILRALGNIKL